MSDEPIKPSATQKQNRWPPTLSKLFLNWVRPGPSSVHEVTLSGCIDDAFRVHRFWSIGG